LETCQPRCAAYIATWLELLKNDNRAIFTAAAHSQFPEGDTEEERSVLNLSSRDS
jgi:antirestriction protein ArdC